MYCCLKIVFRFVKDYLFGSKKRMSLKSIIFLYPWICYNFPSSRPIAATDTNKDW